MGSFPMQLVPVFEIIEKSDLYNRLPTMQCFMASKRLFSRALLVLISATGALIVPKFGLFINLNGSFACTALAFVMPVWMYNQTHEGKISLSWKFTHYIIVIFGTICGAISFIVSILEIIEAFKEPDPSSVKMVSS